MTDKDIVKEYVITLKTGEEEFFENGSLDDIKNYVIDNKIDKSNIEQIYSKEWTTFSDGREPEEGEVEVFSCDDISFIVDYDNLPDEVKGIVESVDTDNEDDYKELSRVQDELAEIGWYMDFYLDAEITELRPMTDKEVSEHEKDKLALNERRGGD